MKLTLHKQLITRAVDLLELYEYAERRQEIQNNHLKRWEDLLHPGSIEKYKHGIEITEMAKSRILRCYQKTISKLEKLSM